MRHVVPQLPPRYVAGRRIHHGLAGLILAVLGAVLMADDWHDRKHWIRDFLNVRSLSSNRKARTSQE